MRDYSGMPTATFRFNGSLNDFLPAACRGRPVEREFEDSPGVKDVVQALGVPHPEIDFVVANQVSVGLDYRLLPGDRIYVYGLDRPQAPAGLRGWRGLIPPPPEPPRFVLDGHLGRLARYLRMLGFDTLYDGRAQDADLARASAAEDRILLTRDRGLLKRSIVRLGYLIRDDDPRRQLVEVVRRYGLASRAAPFTRCVRCNGAIRPVDRADVVDRLADQPRTLRFFNSFGRCDDCDAIYWPGSHFERMSLLMREVLRAEPRIGENWPDERACQTNADGGSSGD